MENPICAVELLGEETDASSEVYDMVYWVYRKKEIPLREKMTLVALSFLFLYLAWTFWDRGQDKKKCAALCEIEGFPHVRYVPDGGGRGGPAEPARCFCLTEEESTVRGKIPRGVEIPLERE